MQDHFSPLAALCLSALLAHAAPAAAQANQGIGAGRDMFIGVFNVVNTGAAPNPQRCPDADHPQLLSFTGIAYTTLGSATFTQTHCQNLAQSSFIRGEKRITFSTGEMLFASYQGRLMPTPTTATDGRIVVEATWRNNGGTGSLSQARGIGSSAGTVDTFTGATTIAEHGRL